MISLILRRHFSLSSLLYARITRVPLPALSPTMESGSIVSWDKKEGDQLSEGDLLAEIETDKATMAFETPEEGYLAKILVPAGTKGVPLGQPLCIIVESEDDVTKFKDFSIEQAISAAGGSDTQGATASSSEASSPVAAPQSQAPPAPTQSPTPAPQTSSAPPSAQQTTPSANRTFASPLAKKLAKEMGVQIPNSGSGPNGRVVAGDLQNLSAGSSSSSSGGGTISTGPPPPPPQGAGDFIDIPMTNMRQTIAKRLTQSKQQVPHYYLTVNLKVDELLELRQHFNSTLSKDGIKLSVNDFIVKAAALSCKKVPQVNSIWQETFIRQYDRVDVCIAVATDSGLITPIVFNAENKGVQDISSEIRGLAERARQGKLQPHEFQGGTFTISNLGMFEIQHFTAVINPPQSAILAVGSTQQQIVPATPKDISEGGEKFKIANTLNVTLSCDHRVVDGAIGAQWLQWFRRYMEKPMNMLL